MSENITPLEWLWKQLEERLGPDATKVLHEEYKAQLRAYQKHRKQENKRWEEERIRKLDAK